MDPAVPRVAPERCRRPPARRLPPGADPREIPLLAERFREAGYLTLGSTGGGLVAQRFGFGRGFDVYRSREKTSGDEPGGELEKGVEETLEWLTEHAHEPFFLFLHTYETHTPLEPREPFFTRLRGHEGPHPDRPLNAEPLPARADNGFRQLYRFAWTLPLPDGSPPPPPPPGLDLDDPQLAIDLYDSTIANLDAALGRVLARLEELGLAEETIVVFTSDHGESFGENGLYAHTHLQDSNLMVPLVVSPRPRGGPRVVDAQVRVVDVAPTLLEMAGLPPLPSAPGQGRSLVPLVDGATSAHPELAWSYAARTNRGLGLRVANRWKLVVPNTVWSGARGRTSSTTWPRIPTRAGTWPGVTTPTPPCGAWPSGSSASSPRGWWSWRAASARRASRRSSPAWAASGSASPPPTWSAAASLRRPAGPGSLPGPATASPWCTRTSWTASWASPWESAGPSGPGRELRRRVGPGQAPFALRQGESGWEVEEGAEEPPGVGLHVSYRGTSTEALPEVAREMEDRLRALGYIK